MPRKIALFLVPVLVVLLTGAGALGMQKPPIDAEPAGDLAELNLNEPTPAAGDAAKPAAPAASAPAESKPAEAAPAAALSDLHVVVDGGDPKAPRTLGAADAPVTIIDYSSLTCPHCADAHASVLPQLIKDYVQTGKVRIVFNDFPLNSQAMDASKVARCISNEQYFNFESLLFSTIEQWAYSGRHPDALIQNAVLSGLSDEKAKACMGDKDIEQAIIEGVQQGIGKYGINATPTFVFNDGAKVLQGARPYSEFKDAIDTLLNKTAAPATN